MAYETFIVKKFTPSSYDLISKADTITQQYAAQGYDLSLRQLYYQFVSRNWLANSEANYNRLGSVINDARLAGLIDWATIKDRGRGVVRNQHWDSPKQILTAAANGYQIDKWQNQPNHVEVMVEKQALEGVLVPVCAELDVPFSANKGYSSATAMYETSKRMQQAQDAGKTVYVLYLGDHDPSGIDMTRDVFARLGLFLGDLGQHDQAEYYQDGEGGFASGLLAVHRLALNMSQIEQYDPPPNPAKMSDSRVSGYVAAFGYESWELDALEPTVLADLVRVAVLDVRDPDLWAGMVAKQDEQISYLTKVADEYQEAS